MLGLARAGLSAPGARLLFGEQEDYRSGPAVPLMSREFFQTVVRAVFSFLTPSVNFNTFASVISTREIAVKKDLQTLPVMETFYSIQGEGYHTGKAAYFIRLAGCDVGCVWCDVKESWDASKHPRRPLSTLVEEAAGSGAELVIITGGEPAMYDLGPLTAQLNAEGLQVHIETSGAHPLSGDWHWICFSPKKFKEPLPEIYQRADELKVVVYNKHDLEWAEQHAAHVNAHCRLFLQPEWSKRDRVAPLIADYIRQHPEWRVSLQTHKYLNLP